MDIWGYLYNKFGNPNIGIKDKYKGLIMPYHTQWLLENNPEEFKKYCNGVGSKVGFWSSLLYHITPNTIYGLNISPASDCHDVGYSHPDDFNSVEEALSYKSLIDRQFYENMKRLIVRQGGFLMLARLKRATSYYKAVKNFGEDSFLKGKVINGHEI